jgi:hypothetical protein
MSVYLLCHDPKLPRQVMVISDSNSFSSCRLMFLHFPIGSLILWLSSCCSTSSGLFHNSLDSRQCGGDGFSMCQEQMRFRSQSPFLLIYVWRPWIHSMKLLIRTSRAIDCVKSLPPISDSFSVSACFSTRQFTIDPNKTKSEGPSRENMEGEAFVQGHSCRWDQYRICRDWFTSTAAVLTS